MYGASDYQITYPLCLIELPSDELINKGALFCILPKEMQHYLTCSVRKKIMHNSPHTLSCKLTDNRIDLFHHRIFITLLHNSCAQPVNSSAEVDVLVIFHSLPSFESSTDPTARHVNIMFHMWALKGTVKEPCYGLKVTSISRIAIQYSYCVFTSVLPSIHKACWPCKPLI